ncbi:MAG: GIY-YIG nuclease family protein, partial [Brevundimonas sp.]
MDCAVRDGNPTHPVTLRLDRRAQRLRRNRGSLAPSAFRTTEGAMVTKGGLIGVYIMTGGMHGTLYVGVTSDLIRRIWEHRTGQGDGFTKRYGLTRLVWYEVH